ncbi:MAG: hypothetical protein NC548_34505 [Lachnospiraceae bacterium]|nr:hypothetical protein [Lachnospiraceae bacterium]
MISDAVVDLESVIERLVTSQRKKEDISRFREDLGKYVRQEQRRMAVRMLTRIYDNERSELFDDIKSGEIAKVLIALDEKALVSGLDRKKLLGILYPVLNEEFGINL